MELSVFAVVRFDIVECESENLPELPELPSALKTVVMRRSMRDVPDGDVVAEHIRHSLKCDVCAQGKKQSDLAARRVSGGCGCEKR